MSILIKSAVITACTLVAGYSVGLFTGPSISTEIEIAAPAHTVWEELTNGADYPEWNPFVKHLSGNLEVGDHLNVTIQSEGNSPMDFTPEVLVADDNCELRWVGKLGFKGVFDGEHYFILEETANGTTILRHGENFTGMLAYPLLAVIRKDTLKGFEAMNAALKVRAETNA
jgi:hypothetical protein